MSGLRCSILSRMGYDSHGSGFLTGGGTRGAHVRQNVVRGGHLKHEDFPDTHITDSSRIKAEIPDFDSDREFEYTARELLLLAEKILLEDPKPPREHPTWLSARKLRQRQKCEIYVANGTPDPSVESGMYWRTHPDGRPWVPEHLRRRTDASFYGTRKYIGPILPPLPPKEEKLCSFGCGYLVKTKGFCAAHYQQVRLGEPLRPVKRHVGKSKFAKRCEDQVERMAAKA